MKIALLIHGHMRTYKKCFPGLVSNLLDPYQPDVFIHTWTETEPHAKTWHNRKGTILELSEDALNEIADMYNPTDIYVGIQPPVDPVRVTPNNNLSYDGQKSMLWGMQQACILKRQHEEKYGFTYDVVVKIRPDILLMSPLEISKPARHTVCVASNKIEGGPSRACDIINIASSANMNGLCNVHDHFDRFYVDNVNEGKLTHSGYVDYMLWLGLRPVYIDYLYGQDWTIVRGKK